MTSNGRIPLEILFGNPERTSPQLSPDGTRLAYLAPDQGVLNVWVRSLKGGDDRPVTSDRRRGIRAYFWQEDSRHILYLQDFQGDENWHIHQTELETGKTRDLTPFPGVQAQVVAADPDFPDVLLAALNRRDPRLHDVYRLDLTTGEAVLDTENPGDVVGWTADNKLRVRAAKASLSDGGTEIRLRDEKGGPWTTFETWGPDEGQGGVVGFTPDDQRVWLLSSVGANASRLVEAGPGAPSRVLAQDPVYDADNVLVHPRTRRLEAVLFRRARREWKLLEPGLEADFKALAAVKDGDVALVSRDNRDERWIAAFIQDDGPVSYFLYERASRKASFLFSDRPALEAYKLAKMKPVSFKARDGLTLHGYLTLPRGRAAPGPLVVLVHGGPWVRDMWGYSSEVQWLADRGLAVLQINYRGSAGYGKAHLNAGDRQWGARMLDDLIDGKRWAVREGVADPGRVAIYGGSYGGYAVLAALAFAPEEFACGVDIVGPSNLSTLIRSIPPYWAPLKAVFDKRVGRIETEEEFLRSRSPLFFADRMRAPLLIAQGANDPRVKQAESDQIVQALRKNGRPAEYLVFADEGHGFARPENRLKFYAAAEAFLARHLIGSAASRS